MKLVVAITALMALPLTAQDVGQGGVFQAHEVDQFKVDRAISRGVESLKRGSHTAMFKHATSEMSHCELVLYTYVHAGVPETDSAFQALWKDMMDRKLMATYCVSLQAMILEDVERVKHQKRIAQCAQFLCDNQSADGYWGYGAPSIFVEDVDVPTGGPKRNDVASSTGPVPVKKFDPSLPAGGLKQKPVVKNKVKIDKKRDGQPNDNSNSQYAALGMRACHDSGIIIDPKVIDLAQRWWRDTQKAIKSAPEELMQGGVNGPDKAGERKPGGGTVAAPQITRVMAEPQGWCYGKHEHEAYGSMTAGAVGALAIYDYIKDNDGGKKRSWKTDKDIHEGLVWLGKYFSVTYNPGPYEHANMEKDSKHQWYYYLYALERVGMLYGTEIMGKHKWYPEGAKFLIEAQKADGSWEGGAVDTCFAILFLKRATRPLDVMTHSVSGK